MERTPGSWAEALHRLALALGGGEAAERDAGEWLRQGLEAVYGVQGLHDLAGRPVRALAFQRFVNAVLAVEDAGEVAFMPDQRAIVAGCFKTRWGDLDGPPWRVSWSKTEAARPTYDEWRQQADF